MKIVKKSDRTSKLLGILEETESVETDLLASMLDVSVVTLRRDLKTLQEEGRVMVGYGFVRLIKDEVSESVDFSKRLRTNREEKQKLAVEAIKHIKEGDVIFLDESSTCYVLATNLVRSFNSLHVITNAVHTLQALSSFRGLTVESSGGTLQYGFNSLIGPRAEQTLRNIYANKFFFSCRAFREKERALN